MLMDCHRSDSGGLPALMVLCAWVVVGVGAAWWFAVIKRIADKRFESMGMDRTTELREGKNLSHYCRGETGAAFRAGGSYVVCSTRESLGVRPTVPQRTFYRTFR